MRGNCLFRRISGALCALSLVWSFGVSDGISMLEASHIDDDGEFEDYTDWFRRQSRDVRREIDELDNDPVDAIPIPILFGVTLDGITPNFGDPRGDGSREHEGLDMHAPEGTPIVSPTEAVVMRTGRGSSAGHYVYTANPGGETFVYMHLSEVANIDAGDRLDPGELIGYVGDTGNANGVSHLHFEIRENGPTDPYPRITEVFSREEKIEFLESMLRDVEDEDELAEFLVETFPGEFLIAAGLNIELPDEIEDALDENGLTTELSSITGTLERGDENDDVIILQSFLIGAAIGPASENLAVAGATGYFGPLTEAALIEYQEAAGITPATGVFAGATHRKIAAADVPSGGARMHTSEVDGSSAAPYAAIPALLGNDISIGATGPEIQLLQLVLMLENTGPAARELLAVGATGYFGPLTQAAFREYQEANGIAVSGMYDAPTRAFWSGQ